MNSFYVTGALKPEFFPPSVDDLREVAFIGRSNTGKSSLINTLTGQKNLARKSQTPGRTQLVHFFQLEKSKTQKCLLADLPGYGYNVAQKDIQKLWDELLQTYLDRPTIEFFCCLFDIRRSESIEDFEWSFLKDLSRKRKLTIILTKSDKISLAEQQKKQTLLQQQLQKRNIQCLGGIYCVSNLNKKGIEQLRDSLFV